MAAENRKYTVYFRKNHDGRISCRLEEFSWSKYAFPDRRWAEIAPLPEDGERWEVTIAAEKERYAFLMPVRVLWSARVDAVHDAFKRHGVKDYLRHYIAKFEPFYANFSDAETFAAGVRRLVDEAKEIERALVDEWKVYLRACKEKFRPLAVYEPGGWFCPVCGGALSTMHHSTKSLTYECRGRGCGYKDTVVERTEGYVHEVVTDGWYRHDEVEIVDTRRTVVDHTNDVHPVYRETIKNDAFRLLDMRIEYIRTPKHPAEALEYLRSFPHPPAELPDTVEEAFRIFNIF
ncbi:MAG: hypothetical protein KatS3mg054_0638 [Chloroflexus sp.]|nr:MAG: hypothetical protein KatS3mg054_0638 [Chloroflexus sp.]